jgi:hypothetical protein
MKAMLTLAAVHEPTVLAVDPAKVKPGWLALVIILLMGLATYLLWRSMNRQLKKVDFDDGSGGDTDRPVRDRPVPDGAPRDGSAATRPGTADEPPPDDGGAGRP